jgi:glutathione synthase
VIETCPTEGLMVKENTTRGDTRYIHAPLSLVPTPFPVDMMSNALNLQIPMGELICGIIHKPESNIHQLLADFSEKDEFMNILVEISKTFNEQRKRGEPSQNNHMCILRSDYMLDMPTSSVKLVEYNTIASSFGCLSQKVGEVHEYVRSKYEDDLCMGYSSQG